MMSLKRKRPDINEFMRDAKRQKLAPVVARAVSRQVRKQIAKGEEVKYHDTYLNAGQSDVGGMTHLVNMIQGDNQEERIGNKIKPKFIEARLTCYQADSTNIIRIIFFQWHNNDVPTPDQILDPVAMASQNGVHAPYYSPSGLFRILSDRTYNVDVTGNPMAKCDVRITAPMRECEYEFTTTAGAEHLWVCTISDSSAVGHPTLKGVIRVGYTE